MILTVEPGELPANIRFSGLMSRWMMPQRCSADIASRTCSKQWDSSQTSTTRGSP